MSDEQSTQNQPTGGKPKRKPPRPLRDQVERMITGGQKPRSKPQSDGSPKTRSMVPREDGDDDDDDEFEDSVGNSIVIGIIVLGLLVLGFFVVRSLLEQKPIDPAYSKIEGIKRMRELTLVKHHYESIIPVGKPARKGLLAKKDNPKIEFLIKAPIEVRGYMDMSDIHIELGRDSLMLIDLPEAEMSRPVINFDETTEYTVRKNLWKRFFDKAFSDKATYLVAYDEIWRSLDSAKNDVSNRARINGILEDTEEKAKEYLLNAITAFGYRVEFVEEGQNGGIALPDSLGMDQVLEQIREGSNLEEARSSLGRLIRRGRLASNLIN